MKDNPQIPIEEGTTITEQLNVVKNCVECGSTDLHSGGGIKEPRMCLTCFAAMVGFTQIGGHFFDSDEVKQQKNFTWFFKI